MWNFSIKRPFAFHLWVRLVGRCGLCWLALGTSMKARLSGGLMAFGWPCFRGRRQSKTHDKLALTPRPRAQRAIQYSRSDPGDRTESLLVALTGIIRRQNECSTNHPCLCWQAQFYHLCPYRQTSTGTKPRIHSLTRWHTASRPQPPHGENSYWGTVFRNNDISYRPNYMQSANNTAAVLQSPSHGKNTITTTRQRKLLWPLFISCPFLVIFRWNWFLTLLSQKPIHQPVCL